jgi:hypothetical protein
MKENQFISAWRQAAATKDAGKLMALLADGARLISPVAFKPYDNRAEIQAIFGAILKVLPDLQYTQCESFAGGALMTFEGTLAGGVKVEGIDVFKLSGDGQVNELKVFVRPLKAAQAFAEAMGKALAG